jgi:hypothetical protein
MKKQNFATAELDIKKSVAPETYLLLLNLLNVPDIAPVALPAAPPKSPATLLFPKLFEKLE